MGLVFFDDATYNALKNTSYRHRKERNKYKGPFPTIEELDDLAMTQNGKCFWSNEELVFSGSYKFRTVSLDRIIPRGEYTIDNLRLVHKIVNQMQKCYPDDTFLNMVMKIARYKGEINEL